MGKFDHILSKISTLPLAEQEALLRDLEELEQKKNVEEAQSNFLPFVRHAQHCALAPPEKPQNGVGNRLLFFSLRQ